MRGKLEMIERGYNMVKQKQIHLIILRNLLLSDEYISAANLGELCGCSAKTVLNYMAKVKQVVVSFNIQLECKKGRGYLVIADNDNKKKLAFTLLSQISNFNLKQERFFYMLYLLLSDENGFKISECESILYCSCPTLYCTLDEIEIWLGKYNIQLNRRRNHGVWIVCGEKRHRLAVNQWIIECLSYLKQKSEYQGYFDFLKLQKCINEFSEFYDTNVIEEIASNIQSLMNIKVSSLELNQYVQNLKVSLIRVKDGHTVKIPVHRQNLIESIDRNKIVEKITTIIYKSIGLKISNEEAIYLYTFLFVSDDENLDDQYLSKFVIDNELITKVKCFFKERLNLNENSLNDLLILFEKYLKIEIYYQINERIPSGSEYYSQLTKQFSISSEFANQLCKIIQSTYDIKFYEKFRCNLTILISIAIEKSKENLKCCFVYDCGRTNLEFLLLVLRKYLICIDIVQIVDYNDLKKDQLIANNIDLIFTTCELLEETNVPVTYINRTMSIYEITCLNESLYNQFLKTNLSKIIKN